MKRVEVPEWVAAMMLFGSLPWAMLTLSMTMPHAIGGWAVALVMAITLADMFLVEAWRGIIGS